MTLSVRIRVIIIEDQQDYLDQIERLVSQQQGFSVVGTGDSVADALQLASTTHPDLLLLDINLADGTAFDILEQIPLPTYKVIFLTAYDDYAIKAIKYGALDYIVKPIKATELTAALLKVANSQVSRDEQLRVTKQHYADGNGKRIVLSSQQFLHIIELADIMYCQSDAGYTTFYLTGERKIVMPKNIKEFEELLPASTFIKTHQSHIVNYRFIDKYDKEGLIVLQSGTIIPVAVRRREQVLNYLKNIQ